MNRIDELLARRMQAERNTDEQIAARVTAALQTRVLPAQRRPWLRHWPSALLNNDFAPAWPRLAALGCVALIGCTVGFFGPATPAFQRAGLAFAQNSDPDVNGFVFEPEPLTGARP